MNRTLVILAAGVGRRYGGPKQMEPVGPSGEFIIDYSVFDAIQTGFNKVVFVITRQIESAFRETLGARIEKHIRAEYACQELSDVPDGFTIPGAREKPWGTGHAVFTARDAVNEPFAVINADDFYGRESFERLARFLEETSDSSSKYCMVGFLIRNTVSLHGYVSRGICEVGADGLLKSVVERTRIEKHDDAIRFMNDDRQWHKLTGDELVSMNMWGLKHSVFGYLEKEFRGFLDASRNDHKAEFFVPTVVNSLMERNEVTTTVLETPCRWLGVTYRHDKETTVAGINKLIKSGTYPERLWE